MTHKHDIVVIGASAGGVEALIELVQALPADFPAAVFIVLHVARGGTSILPQILTYRGALPACHPQPGDVIEHGKIYVAPNDHHLMIQDGHVILSNGPRENGFRPAVDTLFRTAASTYKWRVIGVILTGLLDNGAAGLVEVKAHGGLTIVQDPADAMFPSMPREALKVVDADYVLPLADIPETLIKLVTTEVTNSQSAENPFQYNDSARTGDAEYIHDNSGGAVSDLVCPECGGVMVEYKTGQDDNLISFKCRVGHRYSLQSMLENQNETVEAALWAAVRSLEESASLNDRMAQRAHHLSDPAAAEQYTDSKQKATRQADLIRSILLEKS